LAGFVAAAGILPAHTIHPHLCRRSLCVGCPVFPRLRERWGVTTRTKTGTPGGGELRAREAGADLRAPQAVKAKHGGRESSRRCGRTGRPGQRTSSYNPERATVAEGDLTETSYRRICVGPGWDVWTRPRKRKGGRRAGERAESKPQFPPTLSPSSLRTPAHHPLLRTALTIIESSVGGWALQRGRSPARHLRSEARRPDGSRWRYICPAGGGARGCRRSNRTRHGAVTCGGRKRVARISPFALGGGLVALGWDGGCNRGTKTQPSAKHATTESSLQVGSRFRLPR